MGIGIQSEPCGEVAQHTADCFDVHPILQGECCEGVAQVVESVLVDTGPFEDTLQHIIDTVRGDGAAVGGWEDVGILQLFRLCFLLFQNFYCLG